MSARHFILTGVMTAAWVTAASARPLAKQAWPECSSLKPGFNFAQASARLGRPGRRAGFALVDNLPVATYAFRRASRTCRVQFEEGGVRAAPILR